MKHIVVACSSHWLSKNYLENLAAGLTVTVMTRDDEFTLDSLDKINPDHVFLPHWNWKIPLDIIEAHKPIIFHTAPLPRGRGGSPIQNLILSGYKTSPVWALFATEKFDEGPLITSREISLAGNLSEIFERVKSVVLEMICEICEDNFTLTLQEGEVEVFKRLTISDNRIPETVSIESFYDRIRMVDAPGYPNAYIDYGDLRIEFESSTLKGDEIITHARIRTLKS